MPGVFADQQADFRPVTFAETVVASGSSSTITEVVFTGQAASLQTQQPITTAIRNPGGSLGDILLEAAQGITADITADSIVGNIDAANGGIAGIIQTTVGDLGRAHPDLPGLVERLDVMRWGHAMVRPRPGFVWGRARREAAKPVAGVHFAHSELSGLALFEEAFYHGVRAAEEVLRRRGERFAPMR